MAEGGVHGDRDLLVVQGGSAIITDLLAFLGGWTKNRIDDLLGGRGRMGDVTRSHRNTLTTLHP